MYKIRLIWVGKTQDAYLKTGIDQYLSKLQYYSSISCLETRAGNYAHGNQRLWRIKDTEAILKKLHASDTTIVLDERGQQKSSRQLARLLEQQKTIQRRQLNFVIGGPYGLELSLFKNPILLSLSPMTFPHQMVRLILMEQIYRAFKIINDEPYHH